MRNTIHNTAVLQNLVDLETFQFTAGETELRNALPRWIHRASSSPLKKVLEQYLAVTEEQLQKLEEVKEPVNVSSAITNNVIKALIEDAEEKIEQCKGSEIQDACLLACIHSINHFKLINYNTGYAFANALGMEKEKSVFMDAEINEKQIDETLSDLEDEEYALQNSIPTTSKIFKSYKQYIGSKVF